MKPAGKATDADAQNFLTNNELLLSNLKAIAQSTDLLSLLEFLDVSFIM
jgi:hypothetical protein